MFQKAKYGVENYTNAQAKEQEELEYMYSKMLIATDGTVTLNLENLEKIILDKTYPVGSVYITTNDKNPGDTLGGTWEKYSQGRTLIGDGEDLTGDDNGEKVNFNAGNTGGEYNHFLTQNQLPKINGSINAFAGNSGSNGGGYAAFRSATGVFAVGLEYQYLYNASGNTMPSGGAWARVNLSFGNDEAHNNIQPYIVTYMWKRIN